MVLCEMFVNKYKLFGNENVIFVSKFVICLIKCKIFMNKC